MDIHEIKQIIASSTLAFFLAFLGRMAWHLEQVRQNRRRFFSMYLLWEVCMALCVAFVVDGIATYFGFTGKPAMAVMVILSYLGPRGIEAILRQIARIKV